MKRLNATRCSPVKKGRRRQQGKVADNRLAAHLHLAEGYVSQVFCIKPSDFFMRTRGRRPVAEARQLVMYLAHVEFGLPLREVGKRYFRDRSTASYACRKTENRRDDPRFDTIVRVIEARVSLTNDPLFDGKAEGAI